MMFYVFDNWGWYVGMSEFMTVNTTEVEPPEESSALRAYWANGEWILREYVEPPPMPVVVQPVELTQADFWGRFTLDEESAIRDSTAAKVKVAVRRLDREQIVVPSEVISDYLDIFVQAGLLISERAVEIVK